MPHRSSAGSRDLAKLVEKQMRNWELARGQRSASESEARPEVEPFIAISRAAGAIDGPAAVIPEQLGQRLGWPVFDKELLLEMAENDRVRQQLYTSLDERDMGWFEENLRALMEGAFKKNDYFHRLVQAVLAIARQGSAVFVGRGTDCILPRERGLCVRITASPHRCAENYAAARGIDLDQAQREVAERRGEASDFIRRHYKVEAHDQNRHDIILNAEQFSTDQIIDLILAAARMRGIIQ